MGHHPDPALRSIDETPPDHGTQSLTNQWTTVARRETRTNGLLAPATIRLGDACLIASPRDC